MMIKGCLLALAIASTYAADDKPNKARNGVVRNYNGPYKAGGSNNSGYGKPNFPANQSWRNQRRRPATGRFRRRKPRPANWVRPSRPANWQGSTENKSYGSENDYTDDDYDKCDVKLCCDLPASLPEQQKKEICGVVGCDYDKCDWSDDGYDTHEPTSEPTWSADGWQKDGWNDDGHYVCLQVSQCNQYAFTYH